MTQTGPDTYSVGGVTWPRPFKVRRFGHFGYNLIDLDAGVRFYTDVMGFRVTDQADLFDSLPERIRDKAKSMVSDGRMYFTSHGSDHHALLLAHSTFGRFNQNTRHASDNTLSQITWQVGSLAEVVDALDYLERRGVRIGRVGRDMPGGNWHVYFLDPDGNTVELYYGMEQIGWSRNSRPSEMHDRAFTDRPRLPQVSEAKEIAAARRNGVDIFAGSVPDETHLDETYDVEGVLLARPFKVTNIGPISMFTDNHEEMVDFYVNTMGFTVTETEKLQGEGIVFLRHGVEHHSLVLAEKALREKLGLSPHTSNLAIGYQVGTYSQLRAAVEFLREKGYEERADLPPELHRGIDFAAHFQDPDGHLVQLYFDMDCVGWDGKPKPRNAPPGSPRDWPENITGSADMYSLAPLMGPLG